MNKITEKTDNIRFLGTRAYACKFRGKWVEKKGMFCYIEGAYLRAAYGGALAREKYTQYLQLCN